MRAAEDPEHTARLNRLRTPTARVSRELLQQYKMLQQDDVVRVPAWADATVIVTNNAQRITINTVKAKGFSERCGRPMLRWRRRFRQSVRCRYSAADRDLLHSSHVSTLTELFVAGAPAVLKRNINP